jgi:hypothetical protein
MSWRLITDDWRLKLLAFGLAVLMLGAVAFSQYPPSTRTLGVRLGYFVPPNIVLINPPTRTNVTFTGVGQEIANINSSNLVATVDATRALPGTAVRLNVTAHLLGFSDVKVANPAPIAVDVDTLQAVDVPVQVIARAGAGWNLTKTSATCPGAAAPSPCTVHFTGPVTWEKNLTATTTLPGQIVQTSIDWPNQQVVLQNGTGQVDLSVFTEPATTVDVTTANIHVEATPGASSSTVPLVDSPPSHGPPPGYRVTGITITPVTVTISGDAAAVGRVQRITLPAVDLSKSTSDATFPIAIDYQALNVSGSVPVATIKYSISPNPNVSPGASPT